MATQSATQTAQLPLYGAPQGSSPVNSVTATPTNVSPTSPRTPNPFLQHQLPLASRQLRPPKSPLYVPAVLRPTERPTKQPSPLTPPRSVSSSMDSIHDGVAPGVSRSSTADSKNGLGPVLEDTWRVEEEFGEVTGQPTREHWKADSASQICDSPHCTASFNIFLRRHHCRHCGHVFCGAHTPNNVPLDQDAKFHPDGVPSRACEHCYGAWKRWETARCAASKRSNSGSTNASENSSITTPTSPAVGMKGAKGFGEGQPVDIAASVPRDWSWSTF